jgi:arylformamidase
MMLLSHFLDTETPTYGNRDNFIVNEVSQIKKGSSANSSEWKFSTNHIGTHLDVPYHFFENGQTITDYKNDFWYSKKCFLIDVPCNTAELINLSEPFSNIPKDVEVLLIRTGYENFRSQDKYWNDNPGLSPELGIWLKSNFTSLRIVGFDFISLTSWKFRDEGKEAHRNFLGSSKIYNPICIIEDMALSKIKNQIIDIIISPLFVKGSNGSPVTVFANLNA